MIKKILDPISIFILFFVTIIFVETLNYFPVEKRKIKVVDVQRVCAKNNCYWILYSDKDIYKIEDSDILTPQMLRRN